MPNVCAHQRKQIIMTENKTQFSANIEYVIYFVNNYDGREHPINWLIEEDVTLFVETTERYTPGHLIEEEDPIFHGAPVFDGLVGPIYGKSPDTGKVCLNYIQQELVDVLDYDDNPLLEVRSEVEETIRPLLV